MLQGNGEVERQGIQDHRHQHEGDSEGGCSTIPQRGRNERDHSPEAEHEAGDLSEARDPPQQKGCEQSGEQRGGAVDHPGEGRRDSLFRRGQEQEGDRHPQHSEDRYPPPVLPRHRGPSARHEGERDRAERKPGEGDDPRGERVDSERDEQE
jgi:hypothetical protein